MSTENLGRILRELYRRGLFGLLVSNTDNHARNHGLLRTGTGWRLSPQVNPTTTNKPGEKT